MDDQLSCLIVDDEPLARESIQLLLAADREIRVAATCTNGEEALGFLKKKSVQLLFLDIQMPKLNGFEVLQHLSKKEVPPAIVFVTAFDDFALDAFAANAIDYLLKPYSDQRFYQALDKAKMIARSGNEGRQLTHLLAYYQSAKKYRTRLAVKHKHKWLIIEVRDILYIQAAAAYAEIHTSQKTHLIHASLKQLEQELDPTRFLRIHRSTIINLSYVQSLEPYFNGEFFVTLAGGARLKISRKYRDRADIILGKQ